MTQGQRSPGKVRTVSFLRVSLAVLIVLLIFAFVQAQWHNLREYHLYLTEDRLPVSFAFTELNEDWSEASLAQRFPGLPIRCRAHGQNLATDRACGIDVQSHNGVPALFIAFFFSGDRLKEVAVNVPLWSHQTAHNSLRASFGQPTAAQLLPHHGVRLAGWQLPDGAGLFLNRDPQFVPPYRSAIYWRSPASCAAMTCFNVRRP